MSDENSTSGLGVKILTAFLTLTLGIAAWSFKRNIDAHEQITLMQYKIDELMADSGADTKQDSSISKHWKIVSFHRDQINTLRFKAGLDPISWPNFD